MTEVFTASDLERRRREVLDGARAHGHVLIRDRDGTVLVLSDGRHHELVEELAKWPARVRYVEKALMVHRNERQPLDYGELSWVRHLDDEDAHELVNDVWEALILAERDQDLTTLRRVVAEWRASADAMADSVTREILTGTFDEDEYVEVERPGRGGDSKEAPAAPTRS